MCYQNLNMFLFACSPPSLLKVLFLDFCVEGQPKISYFDYFVLIWWQTDKKQQIPNQSCKDLFIWIGQPIVWLIIGSGKLFNKEVNGAFSIHVIVHTLLTQNRNRLKVWIKDSYVDFHLLMTQKDHAKIKEYTFNDTYQEHSTW